MDVGGGYGAAAHALQSYLPNWQVIVQGRLSKPSPQFFLKIFDFFLSFGISFCLVGKAQSNEILMDQ